MPAFPLNRAAVQRLPLDNGLLLYLLEGESVLFSPDGGCLFGLDRGATVMLLRLAGGEAAERLAAGRGVAEAAAIKELADLLAGQEPPAEDYRPETFCSDEVPRGAGPSPCYRLLTTRFAFSCPDETLCAALSGSLRHLLVPDQPDIDLAINVGPEGALWRIHLNGTPQGSAVPAGMLLPILHDRLRKFAYQRFPYLLAVHAAVVGDGKTTIVLPGQSGSGKSTLAASLLVRGYRLFSDEIAMLDADGDLVPIPLGLGLKSGSWSLLDEDFPALADIPEHIRWDGDPVRYLDPETIHFTQPGDNRRATHLFFPLFRPQGPDSIEPLSPVQALRALTGAGYQVRGLDEERVEKIVTWLLGLSCFAITYSSSESALRLLDSALNFPPTRCVNDDSFHTT